MKKKIIVIILFVILLTLICAASVMGQPSTLQQTNDVLLPSTSQGGNQTPLIHIADNGNLTTVNYPHDPNFFVYSGNGTLLWNVTLSAEQTPWVSSVSISPDGSLIAVSQIVPGCCHGTVTNTSSNKVILFDHSGKKVEEYPTANPPLASAISGNNRDILIGTEDGRIICLDRNGTLRWTTKVDAPVLTLATSRDGSTIIATGESNFLFSKTYNEPLSPHDLFALSENGTLLWNYQTRGWNAAAISDSGSSFAAIERVSGTLRLFNLTGLVAVVPVYPGGLESLAVAGNGNLIVTRTPSGDVYSFTGTGSRSWTLPEEQGSQGIAITGSDNIVLLGDGSNLRLYSRSGAEIANKSLDGSVQVIAAARSVGSVVAATDRSLFFFPNNVLVNGSKSNDLMPTVTGQSPAVGPSPSHKAAVGPIVTVLAFIIGGIGIVAIRN